MPKAWRRIQMISWTFVASLVLIIFATPEGRTALRFFFFNRDTLTIMLPMSLLWIPLYLAASWLQSKLPARPHCATCACVVGDKFMQTAMEDAEENLKKW